MMTKLKEEIIIKITHFNTKNKVKFLHHRCANAFNWTLNDTIHTQKH